MDARLSPNGGTGGLDEWRRKGTDRDKIHPISGLFGTVHYLLTDSLADLGRKRVLTLIL